MTDISLKDIPHDLIPFIASNKRATLYLNGNIVEEIFIFRSNQFRINTNRGQFRYGLDTDVVLNGKLN